MIPIGINKKPIARWGYTVHRPFQARWVRRWLNRGGVTGWAVACGNRSDHIYCLDIEAAGMRDARISSLVASFPNDFVRPTPNGGVHIWVHVTGYLQRTEKLAYGTRVQGKRPLLAEVRGVSANAGKAGAYAVVTGPGRPPLRADSRPLAMTSQQWKDTIALLRACDTRPQRKPAERKSSGTLARSGDTLASRLDRVRKADDGCRNDILNSEVFLATVAREAASGAQLHAVRSAFIEAAVDAGLTSEEAGQTFDSAHSAGMKQLHDAALWAGQALEAAREAGSRPNAALEACVDELSRRFALNGPELRVSARQLADHVVASPRVV